MVSQVWQWGMGAETNRPTDGRIKAAGCGSVGRLKNAGKINDLYARCTLRRSLHVSKTL